MELQNVIRNSKKADEVRRAQAILLINDNAPISSITALTGYQRRQIYTLRSNYLEKGIDSIVDHRKGQPKELLTKKQRDDIIQTVKAKSPRECGYNTDYWTTALLGHYIKDQYEIQYTSRTSYYIIFRGAEFSYHKPGKVSERREEQEVQKWRNEAKKQLQSAWNDSNTVI